MKLVTVQIDMSHDLLSSAQEFNTDRDMDRDPVAHTLQDEMADILWRWHHGEDVTHAEVCNVLDRYETENT